MTYSSDFVAAMLRQRRESCGFSVSFVVNTLREKFNIELNEKTLYGYENGVSVPKVPVFLALCAIYGVDKISDISAGNISFSIAAEWPASLYNDFFNSSLLGKIGLLQKHGIPNFDGYEDKLSELPIPNAEDANSNRLLALFNALPENKHEAAFFMLGELAQERHPAIGHRDLDFLKRFRPYLDRLNSDGVDELLKQAELLATSKKYTTPFPASMQETG